MNLELDELELVSNTVMIEPGIPAIPYGVKLHDYQNEAIDRWADNGYCGIFDMATGTGKTYTGLGAAVRLFSDKHKMALIIVCPYQHLVEQWVEDLIKFNMNPIIAYSYPGQRWRWKNYDDGKLRNRTCLSWEKSSID